MSFRDPAEERLERETEEYERQQRADRITGHTPISEPHGRWVNAVIEITVPLDSVRPEDTPEAKQRAVAGAMSALLGALPEEFAGCVSLGRWEDAGDA